MLANSGCAPKPPPSITLKPRSPAAFILGIAPISWIYEKAVSASLDEKEILNLRPISWQIGLRKKYSNTACAYGETSNGSAGSMPALGEEVTFLTVFPQ